LSEAPAPAKSIFKKILPVERVHANLSFSEVPLSLSKIVYSSFNGAPVKDLDYDECKTLFEANGFDVIKIQMFRKLLFTGFSTAAIIKLCF
jgi:hypothetical protein